MFLLQVRDLYPSKAAQEGDIPTRIIKANSDVISSYLHYNFNNNMLDKGIFPESFKNANITPIFKKESRTEKTIDLLVFLLNLSKNFERDKVGYKPN